MVAVESFELPEKSIVFAVLSTGFPFFSLLVILVQVFEFLSAFLPTPLIPMFLRHYPGKMSHNTLELFELENEEVQENPTV